MAEAKAGSGSSGGDPPPPLAKLLRQLSTDSKAGRITLAQKTRIKTELLSGGASALAAATATVNRGGLELDRGTTTTTTVVGENGGGGGGDDESLTTDSKESIASAPAPAASAEPLALVPLLRQLSACTRDGLIDSEQKATIKVGVKSFCCLRVYVS